MGSKMTAEQYHGGGTFSRGVASVRGASLAAGGMAFDGEDPDEPKPAVVKSEAARCVMSTKTGLSCRGFASGDDGLCAGHRKQVYS